MAAITTDRVAAAAQCTAHHTGQNKLRGEGILSAATSSAPATPLDLLLPAPLLLLLLLLQVITLDMGLLVAGTKYRGEFEERLKKLMDEIKQNDDIILVSTADCWQVVSVVLLAAPAV